MRTSVIKLRVFSGWLLGSAALHVVALAAIPTATQPDRSDTGNSVQVLLTPSGAARDLAIVGLKKSLGVQTPATSFPIVDAPLDSTSLDTSLADRQLFNDTGFSPLQEAFAKDARVVASLDLLSEVLSVAERSSVILPATSTLVPPHPKTSSQRSYLEPSVSLENVDPTAVTETAVQSSQLPVPITRPRKGAEPPQPLEIASAKSPGSGEAAANEASATDKLTPSSAAVDLNALVSLLHEEIARHKRYPALAKRQRREGTATVSFALYPDGAIDDINVVSSSGFRRLDKAALFAVSEVSPFVAAENYLDRARHFRVNIVFSLQ